MQETLMRRELHRQMVLVSLGILGDGVDLASEYPP